jgi:hypothetical protein
MKISIRRHGCGGLGETLSKADRELPEEADVLVLHRVAGVNSQFLTQQDPQAFVRRERLGHIAAGRQRAHQEQLSRFSERGQLDQLAGGTLRARQLGAARSRHVFAYALECA